MVRNISDFKGLVNGSFNPPPRKPAGNGDSDFDVDECESVAATVVSAPDSTAQAAPADTEQAEEETTLTQEKVGTPSAPTPTAAATPTPAGTPTPDAASTQATSTAAEPVLTTYGSNNQVGIRFLRRSLYKSMSHSDRESICGSQTPTEREAEEKSKEEQQQKEQAAKVSEITRRNLRRPKTKQRLEQAMRKSATPEKEYTPVKSQAAPAVEVVEASPLLNVTSISDEAVSIKEDSTRIP